MSILVSQITLPILRIQHLLTETDNRQVLVQLNNASTACCNHATSISSITRKCILASSANIFTARRNARIASDVLAIAILSVRLSVRLSHGGIV